MRIVILDGYTLNPGDNPWTPIERLGPVTLYDHTPEDQIVARAIGHEIIITNKAVVSADSIAKLPDLRLIVVTATGYNIVDVEAAAKRGIPVCNVPDYAGDSVSQFVFAMLLEWCHRIGMHDGAVKAGEWQRGRDFSFWKSPQTELAGKTFGIIGFGRIGQRVGELAHAFGMNVLAHNPSTKPAPSYSPFAFASLEEVFSRSDVVSLHCPLTASNRGMVNAPLLAKMKRSALLINTARGLLVNEKDLANALNDGTIAGAMVDVVSAEPIHGDNPLLSAKNLIITPHMAWTALEARRRAMEIVARDISAYLAGAPINVVNAEMLSRHATS